jgi:hypothetical protein
MQGLYRHGLDPRWATDLPFVRLPVPNNPKPEPLTNDAFRNVIAGFADDLARVETTLADVASANIKLPLTAKVRYPFNPPQVEEWRDSILDAVAFVHLLLLPVAEPERMKAAHGHLLEVIEQSRLSWAAIGAETDDDREWIPSPQQKNMAIPNAAITPDMVTGWHAVLNELEAILQGEKLVPFWRGTTANGVNLKRVFYEPTPFDLVLWIQGSAAAPYLEEGEVTPPDFWRRIQTGFRGQFFWFALWVN